MGYKFRPNYIIDQGYYNNQYRVPSKEFRDFQAFQRRGGKACQGDGGHHPRMRLRSHDVPGGPLDRHRALYAGVQTIGLDAVVGSVGNGSTLRPISDIEGVKLYGVPLPALLPGHLPRGRRPGAEARKLVTARRAILRKPLTALATAATEAGAAVPGVRGL